MIQLSRINRTQIERVKGVYYLKISLSFVSACAFISGVI